MSEYTDSSDDEKRLPADEKEDLQKIVPKLPEPDADAVQRIDERFTELIREQDKDSEPPELR